MGEPTDPAAPASYVARVRFRMPRPARIGITDQEITIRLNGGQDVEFKAADGTTTSIEKAEWLIARSAGWSSQEEAEVFGIRLMDALRRSLACLGMAADLGTRAPHSFFFRAFLEKLSQGAAAPVLNDLHGAMVFEDVPGTKLAWAGGATLTGTVQGERWESVLSDALDQAVDLSERERAAFDLYSGSFFTAESQDARFALLFAALETLIEDTPRPQSSVDHVDELIRLTRESTALDPIERESLLGSLAYYRNKSIRKGGLRLVGSRLSGRTYAGKEPQEFFEICYKLRNNLLHGNLPRPTRNEVGTLAANLQTMVGHLLAGSLQDPGPPAAGPQGTP